ncbi:hypothetical protein QYE76_008837 [Lolium multiflorum]|uniref:C2H2-type domain-containing protein n=1 Tax=Lolium multiflorum TaxID=4521 RepID=A0AAD8TQU0_LOLMU|nr:hypothetical protein QYE76_008837 [Lolium multiflorum]
MLGRSLACPRRGTMAPSPPPPRVPASATTIDGLDDGTIGEILLRLPSSASLARAVLACRRWGRIASSVLSGFRDRHPSSPFMGIFVSDGGHESLPRPFFLPACSDVPGSDIDAHRDIAAVTRKGDFTLARLDNGHRWRLRDCRNGVLLLSRDNHSSLWVYSPLSGGQPVPIQPRPDDANVEGEFLAHCLLDGTVPQCGQRLAVDCFRVVSVQQRRHRREFRAVEYDSGTREWKRHPWASPPLGNGKLPKWGLMPMYAASRIFWQYDDASLLVLNTRVMVFSLCHLPWKTISQGYSIGEIEDGTGSVQEKKDGKGYLVCLQGLVGWAAIPRLQVWELDADNALLEFNFKEEVPMIKVLGIPYSTRVCDVCTVTNGLAVLTYRRGPHFVVDLQKMSLLVKFQFSGWGYPYQMSWPPTTNSGSTPPPEDTGIDLDDGSAMIQPVETVISSDNSETTLGHLDEQMPSPSRYGSMAPASASIDAHSCSNSLVVESEIISTTMVRKNNPTDQCQKSSIGQLATTEHKPLNKDASNCPQQGDLPRRPRRKEAAHPMGARTRSSHVVQCRNSSMGRPATTEKPLCKRNNLVRVDNLTDEEPGGQRKKLKTKATSNACPEELVQHIPSPSSCNPTTVHQNNPTVPFGNISMRQKATTQHARTNNAKTNLHVEDGNAMLECNSKGCKRMFTLISTLTRHRREVHKNGKCIPCGRCDMKFTRTENLKSHFEECITRWRPVYSKGALRSFLTSMLGRLMKNLTSMLMMELRRSNATSRAARENIHRCKNKTGIIRYLIRARESNKGEDRGIDGLIPICWRGSIVVCRSLNILFLRSMFAHVISMRLEESLQWSFVYKFHVYQNTSCRSTCSSFLCTYRS